LKGGGGGGEKKGRKHRVRGNVGFVEKRSMGGCGRTKDTRVSSSQPWRDHRQAKKKKV